jgi:hypothetical protein
MLGSKMMSSGRVPVATSKLVGALADLDLALRVSACPFSSNAITTTPRHSAAFGGKLEERGLAFLEADRIDDRLAGHAFEASLDHAPFGAVDHHRHPGDVRLGGDPLEEGGHRLFGIEQRLVHVDVDDLGAVLDLLAGDLDRGVIVAGEDQLLESGRSGDVGALADVDEARAGASLACSAPAPERFQQCSRRDDHRLEPGEHRAPAAGRDLARRLACRDLGDCGDMRRGGPAAAADDVDQAVAHPLADLRRGLGRRPRHIRQDRWEARHWDRPSPECRPAGTERPDAAEAGPRRTSS